MLQAVDLGMLDYLEACEIQERAVQDVISCSGTEKLYLVEHFPVYTTGSGGMTHDLPFQVIRTGRGGDVTYHGPGQLVGYPVINLAVYRPDLHAYLRFLEDVLIELVGEWGVTAYSSHGKTGIWTRKGKLASIGIGVKRWVTCHGFALNVSNDLAPFEAIDPCGVPGCPMTSIFREIGYSPGMNELKVSIFQIFSRRLEGFCDHRIRSKGGNDD